MVSVSTKRYEGEFDFDESVNEGKKSKKAVYDIFGALKELIFYIKGLRKIIDDGPYNRLNSTLSGALYKWEIELEKKLRLFAPQLKKLAQDKMLESVNEGMTKYHIRLTKTPGWYGVWDKNGKQKFEGDRKFVTKHLKKLKTRMGNVQLKSLIDVATKRKGKDITFDVVESVNERMDKRNGW